MHGPKLHVIRLGNAGPAGGEGEVHPHALVMLVRQWRQRITTRYIKPHREKVIVEATLHPRSHKK